MSLYAPRYARALVDVVHDEKLDAAQADNQLQEFQEIFASSHALRAALEDPSIPLDEKLKVIDTLAARTQLLPALRNFLAVLLQNGRISALPEIVASYRAEMDARKNIGEAEIVSVRELDASERAALEARAAKLTGRSIRAVYKQDPALLGGVVLRIGTVVYDGSVRGRLERLRQQLAGE
jgi:F-type H+-transporting ATPase subunit delta